MIGYLSIVYRLGNKNKKQPFRAAFFERVRGIEPLSRPWQGRIIATIRYPQLCIAIRAASENRTRTVSLQLDFKSSASTSSAIAAYFFFN